MKIRDIEELKEAFVQKIPKNEIFGSLSENFEFSEEVLTFLKINKITPDITMLTAMKKNGVDELFVFDENMRTIENLPQQQASQASELIELLGDTVYFLEQDNPLFSPKATERLSIKSLAKIYKYGYLPEVEKSEKNQTAIDFAILFNPTNLENFLEVYKNVLGKDTENIDMGEFLRASRKYLKNPQVFNQIMQEQESKEKLSEKIKYYFSYDFSDRDQAISSISDIENIDTLIASDMKKSIEDSKLNGDTDWILSKFLSSNTYITELTERINSQKILDVASTLSIEGDNAKHLETLANLTLFLETNKKLKLNSREAKQFVSEFLKELTDEERLTIFESYSSIEKDTMSVYEQELQESLTSIKEIEDGKRSSSTVEEYESPETGESVNLITIKDQATLIQHVMNAYNLGGTLDLFKSGSGIVTKPILSTSVINNKTDECIEGSTRIGKGGEHQINSRDEVIILFDSAPKGSLIKFGPHDCQVLANPNKLEEAGHEFMTAGDQSELATVDETINKTMQEGQAGTEYIFFIDSGLKPAGIRVVGEEPLQPEINAAIELGVPLVKIEKAREIQEKAKTQKELIPNPKLAQAMEKVNRILDKILEKRKETTISSIAIGKKTLGSFNKNSDEFADELGKKELYLDEADLYEEDEEDLYEEDEADLYEDDLDEEYLYEDGTDR